VPWKQPSFTQDRESQILHPRPGKIVGLGQLLCQPSAPRGIGPTGDIFGPSTVAALAVFVTLQKHLAIALGTVDPSIKS
jgi:hypothetical protein